MHSPDSEGRRRLNSVLHRNIEALQKKRAEEASSASLQDRVAARISAFAGSLRFIYVHALILIAWVLNSLGAMPGIPAFDPTFVILATAASVEAIFLSTFILITQNRSAAAADRRSDLDVQISLLTEHEVTRILDLCTEIADRLGISAAKDPELQELKRNVSAEHVLDEIEEVDRASDETTKH
jgi:uncharacterized membrane protein